MRPEDVEGSVVRRGKEKMREVKSFALKLESIPSHFRLDLWLTESSGAFLFGRARPLPGAERTSFATAEKNE